MNYINKSTSIALLVYWLALPAAAQAACPSYATPGYGLSYNAESAYVPQSTQVVAGGNIDLSTCPTAPHDADLDHLIDLSVESDKPIVIIDEGSAVGVVSKHHLLRGIQGGE